MSALSISNVISSAWSTFKSNSLELSLTFLSYIILLIFSSVIELMGGLTGNSTISFIASAFCGLTNIILTLGFAKIFIDAARGEKVLIESLFSQFKPKLILHYVIAVIIAGFAISIGFILFIIPGIYLAIRLQFVVYNLIEQENPDFFKAIRSSWNITKHNMLDLIALIVFSVVIAFLGVLSFLIGIFIAIPVTMLISTIAYITIKDNYNPNEIY